MGWSEKANSSLLKPRTVTDVEQKKENNEDDASVVSAEKGCPNAGKFRAETRSQMEHSARSRQFVFV